MSESFFLYNIILENCLTLIPSKMLNTSKIPNLQPNVKNYPPDRHQGSLFAELRGSFGKNGWRLLVLTLLMMYFAICWQGERVLRNRVFNFFKEIGANGFGVSYKEPKSSFLALQSGLYLDDLTVTAPKSMGGWQFKAGRISITLNPLAPRNISFSMRGTHSLKTQKYGDIRFVADDARADINTGSQQTPASVKIYIQNVRSGTQNALAGSAFERLFFRLKKIPAKHDGLESFSYSFQTENITLPAGKFQNLPKTVEYLYLSGEIDGVSRQREKPLLKDWLDNSGTVEIKKGEIIWKPLMAEFSATAALNGALEPTVAATAKAYGFFDMLEILGNEHIVSSGNLSVAKVVLGPRLTVEHGENRPSLSTSFSYQDGNLYAGQIVLIEKNTGDEP